MIDRNRLNGTAVMPAMTKAQTTPQRPLTPDHSNGRSRKTAKRSGQRFRMLNDFVDQTMQHLTPRQVAVWLCLFRDSRNGTASAAQSYIAQRCGLRRPTVSKTISELELIGPVVTIHRGGINRGFSRYRVCGIVNRG